MTSRDIAVAIIVALVALAGNVYATRTRHASDRRGQDVDEGVARQELEVARGSYGLDVLQASLAELHRRDGERETQVNEITARLDACEQDKLDLRDEIHGMEEANRQIRQLREADVRRLGERVSDLTTQVQELQRASDAAG